MRRLIETDDSGDTVRMVGACVFSGERYETAAFPFSAYAAWRKGQLIQVAMHMLSADDREFVLNGICPASFEAMFKDDIISDGSDCE